MNIDLGSFAFGSYLNLGSGTPSWGTALGQSRPDYKFTYPGAEVLLIGMVYCSVPLDRVSLPLGKGGRIYQASELDECQLASLFRKVYINGIRINYPFLMVLVREESDSHTGRRSIKYSDKNSYQFNGERFSNQEFIQQARRTLNLADDACWFIYSIEVYNQDELHMSAVIVDENNSVEYENSSERKNKWLELIPDSGEDTINSKSSSTNTIERLQQIFYGAPGTGKSNTIKEEVDDKGKICFRTTFHPDTDYSSFVGCYKPKSHKKNMLNGNGINETQLLSSFFDSNSPKYNRVNKARYLYEALVHTKDIRDLGLDAHMVAEKLNAKGFKGCAYTAEATCMYNIYDWLKEDGYIVENKLSYEFTPQAFIKAYVEAWKQHKNGTPVYLVIEEINRGNCAQIFGDIFQLLDRDDEGYSRYEISPDSDLQEYIEGLGLEISGIKDANGNDISTQIANGELMKLPNNLYIWATMNTSDQSLFPIDSAFKRRWNWEYIKIKNHPEENYKIVIEDEEIDWYTFIQKINEIIASMTSSADKQLGYFFCKANSEGKIDAKTFVGKVIFYLWNDVFKDYGFEDASLFRYTDKEGTERDLTFPDFYDEDGNNVNVVRLRGFIESVMNWQKQNEENN